MPIGINRSIRGQKRLPFYHEHKYVQNVCSVEVCMHHMYNNNGLQEGKQHRRKWKTKREVVKKRKQTLQ